MFRKFEKGNTMYIQVHYRDFDGELTDPVDPKVRILDNNNGEALASTTPQKKKTGVYYCYWTSSEIGSYLIEFTGTIGGHAGIAKSAFEVIETTIENS